MDDENTNDSNSTDTILSTGGCGSNSYISQFAQRPPGLAARTDWRRWRGVVFLPGVTRFPPGGSLRPVGPLVLLVAGEGKIGRNGDQRRVGNNPNRNQKQINLPKGNQNNREHFPCISYWRIVQLVHTVYQLQFCNFSMRDIYLIIMLREVIVVHDSDSAIKNTVKNVN